MDDHPLLPHFPMLQRVIKLGRNLGANIKFAPSDDPTDQGNDAYLHFLWRDCEAGVAAEGRIAIHWTKRAVLIHPSVLEQATHENTYYFYETFLEMEDWSISSYLIHELGHICAARKPPGNSAEFNFLGWEYAFARKVRLMQPWRISLEFFGIGGNSRAPTINTHDFPKSSWRKLLNERLAYAKRHKLVSPEGNPLSYLDWTIKR